MSTLVTGLMSINSRLGGSKATQCRAAWPFIKGLFTLDLACNLNGVWLDVYDDSPLSRALCQRVEVAFYPSTEDRSQNSWLSQVVNVNIIVPKVRYLRSSESHIGQTFS